MRKLLDVRMLLPVSVKIIVGVAFWSLGFMWNIKNEAFLKDVEWLTKRTDQVEYRYFG